MSEHIAFEVCRKKTGNATYSLVQKNGQEIVTKNIQVTYRVHASESSAWTSPNPIVASDVDEEMVRNAPAPATNPTFNNTIPKVGNTTYESPGGLIYPWWRCTNVSVSRNPSNGLEFSVTATFVDSTGKEAGISPPDSVKDVEPVITYSFERFEVTAWTEDDTAPDYEACVLPTGTLFSNPPVKIVGEEIVTYSQYETGFGVPQILGDGTAPGRLFSVNSEQWRVERNGASTHPNLVRPRHAIIDEISYEDTTLLLSSGSRVDCQRVTYTIRIRRYKLESLKDDGTTETLRPGWDQPRVLADTRCKSTSGKLMVSSNVESWGNQQTYLKTTGEPHPTDKQAGVPPYKLLRLQPQLDFDSFLDVP